MNFQPQIRGFIQKQQLTFSSKAEYASGILLEKYVPNFILEWNKTFQVPIGYNKHADFCINGVFIEFHPINLHHEFDDKQALRNFITAINPLPNPQKRTIIDAIKDELAQKYYIKRSLIVKNTFGSNQEVIVCTDRIQFYKLVIRRFGENIPNEIDFSIEFNELCKNV